MYNDSTDSYGAMLKAYMLVMDFVYHLSLSNGVPKVLSPASYGLASDKVKPIIFLLAPSV